MKKAWIFIGISVLLNIIFRVISRSSAELSEWYAVTIYPVIVGIVARLTGLFPFSVVEILAVLAAVFVTVGLVVFVVCFIRNSKGRNRIMTKFGARRLSRGGMLARLVTGVLVTASSLMLVMVLNCEINYQRHPFSYYSGLTLTEYSPEELRLVIDEITEQLHLIVPSITTDENGGFVMGEDKLTEVSTRAMTRLAATYPCLDTYYPPAKPLILSELILSNTLICGVYSPFTIEANYNDHMPDSEKAFTICHELSHLSGFMREDEANFIAFLACRGSGDTDFMYSGYTRALVYCINAYYSAVTYDEYAEMYAQIPEQVRTELILTNDYWRPYRSTVVAEAAGAVNDTYLRVNSQTDGRKSYGRMVDLLIAEKLSRMG